MNDRLPAFYLSFAVYLFLRKDYIKQYNLSIQPLFEPCRLVFADQYFLFRMML